MTVGRVLDDGALRLRPSAPTPRSLLSPPLTRPAAGHRPATAAIDHHVVAAIGWFERAPALVGLAFRQCLVERRLRIGGGADVGLLRDLLARAGELDRLQRHPVRLRSWNRPRRGPSR